MRARLDGSVAALRRQLGDQLGDQEAGAAGIARAADLAERAAAHAPPEGRALFAANTALPRPAEPLARLWQAATLLREHRGDGHVAALATGAPIDVYRTARHLDDPEWAALLDGMRERDLVDAAGRLTAHGHATKERVEQVTDELAAPAYTALSDEEIDDLLAALAPIRAAVVAAGEIPVRSPMGLDLAQ